MCAFFVKISILLAWKEYKVIQHPTPLKKIKYW